MHILKKYLWLRFAIVTLIVFFLDTLSKYIFKLPSLQTEGHFVDITFIQNTGTMWSLFSDVASINIAFIIISFIVLAIIIYLFKEFFLARWAIVFGLLSGAVLGNLLDRILYGSVTDWINFHFWPVFNIADACLISGVIIAVYFLIKYKDVN